MQDFLFLKGWIIFCYVYTRFSLSTHPSIDIKVASRSWPLWIMLQWIWIHKYLFEVGLLCLGFSVFSFLRSLNTVFHTVCTIFIILPTVPKHSSFFTSSPTLGFLLVAALIGVRWYLLVAFIYIYLTINDAEKFFQGDTLKRESV